MAKTRELNLMLSLDRSAPLGQIVKVMDAAKEAGIKTVKCLTREAQGSATRQFCEQGWTHEQEKRYHEALADFTKALELDPENTEALFSRGCLYGGGLPMDKRDYAKAVADYSRFLAIKPRDCSARHNRAGCYEQLREYDKAIADYTRIIEGDTDFSRLVELVGKDKQLALDYHYRGRAYQWYKRDYVRAIADFTEALRLDPAGDDGMVNYRRGQCHQVLKHYAQAEADFRIALDRQPDYANLLCSWAWQLATAPDPRYRDGARALQLAAKGNEILNYQLPDHLDVLAAAYAENGKFDEAIETERKAIATLEQRGIPKTSLSAQGLPDDAKRSMQARLALYAAQRPFRNE